MNALSAIGTNQDPLIAALTQQASASANIALSENPSTPAFVNMIHRMLHGEMLHGEMPNGEILSGNVLSGNVLSGNVLSGNVLSGPIISDTPAHSSTNSAIKEDAGASLTSKSNAKSNTAASTVAYPTATPAQLADAMIRSMLGAPSSRTTTAQSDAPSTSAQAEPTQASPVPSAPDGPVQRPVSGKIIAPQTVPLPSSFPVARPSQASQPEVSQPNVSQPNVSQPNVVQPDVVQPNVAQPNVAQPEAPRPKDDVQPHLRPKAQLDTEPVVAPHALVAKTANAATPTRQQSAAPVESPAPKVSRPLASVPRKAPVATSTTAAPVRPVPMKPASIDTLNKNTAAPPEKPAASASIEASDFAPVKAPSAVVEKQMPAKQPAAAQTSPQDASTQKSTQQSATPQAATPSSDASLPDLQALTASLFSAPAIATSLKPATPQTTAPSPKAAADPTPAPVTTAPLPLTAAVKTPIPNAASSTSSVSQNVPRPSAASPFRSADSKVAFTAVLTPQKDASPNPPAPAAPKQLPEAEPVAKETKFASVPEPSAASSSVSIVATDPPAAAPVVSTTPAQNGTQQSLIQPAPDQNARGNSNDNASSQQQDPSSDTSDRPSPTPDAKPKTAAAKQDASPVQAAAQNAPPLLATSNSAASNFADSNTAGPARAASPATAPKASLETPFQAASDALRTSEPGAPAPPPRAGAAQEITIRIAQPDAAPVDLRVVERAGQVHVDVRTPDAAMQTSLRQDLGTLTNSLQRAGYHTETFTPSTAARAGASSPSGNQSSNQDSRQDSSQNRNGAGDFSGGRRQQQQKRPSTWLEELEEQP